LLLLHLVGFLYYLPTVMTHGQTQIEFKISKLDKYVVLSIHLPGLNFWF
jgi:hypothetical protein